MRELKAQLARPAAAPYFVRWVRRFLSRPASDEPLTDQVRGFCEDLERNGGSEDRQVRQADQALRIYFVNSISRRGLACSAGLKPCAEATCCGKGWRGRAVTRGCPPGSRWRQGDRRSV